MPDHPIPTDLSNTAVVCLSVPEPLQVEPEPMILLHIADRKCPDGLNKALVCIVGVAAAVQIGST